MFSTLTIPTTHIAVAALLLLGSAGEGSAIQEVFGLTSSEFDRECQRYINTR